MNRRFLFIFLPICLAVFLILPKICLADNSEDIILRDLGKHLELQGEDASGLLWTLIQRLTDEKINLEASAYSTAEERAVPGILRQATRIHILNHLLIDAPIQVTGKIIESAVDIAKAFSTQGVSEVLEKFEKETVKKAVEYGMSFLVQNEIRVTPGAIKFEYKSYQGAQKEALFQYLIIYHPLDKKHGKVEIRFYSPYPVEPPVSRGSFMMGIYHDIKDDLPPFIVEIQGITEDYKWMEDPTVKISFPESVPDLGIRPLNFWQRNFLQPIKSKIKDVEFIVTKATGWSLDITEKISTVTEAASDFWGEMTSIFSKIKEFSSAGLTINKEMGAEQEAGQPESSTESPSDDQAGEEPELESKSEVLSDSDEYEESLDDIAENIDITRQKIAELMEDELQLDRLTNQEEKQEAEDIFEDSSEKKEEKVDKEEKEIEEEKKKEVEKKKKEQEEMEKESGQKFCEKIQGSSANRSKLIINEVAWMGSQGSANDEWIELKNISNSEIDLAGWQILDKDQQIKIVFEQESIVANGFFLLERTNDDSVPGMSADLIYSGGLNNTNEFLYLFNADCGLEDEVTANPNWPAGDNGSKRTMERTDNLTWQTSANVRGTPKTENSPGYYDSGSSSSSGGGTIPSSSSVSYPALLITEVQLADSESQKSEFVELYNPNDSDVDLTNWYVQRKTENVASFSTFASKTLFSGKNVQARDYFLIAREGSRFVGLADIITTYALTENNTLVLKNPNKEIVDKLGWGSANDFEASPTQNPQIGQSVGRKWVGGEYQDANNNSKDFEVQIPTPKANNEIDLIAPQVEITSNPSNLTNQAEAIFTFQCSEENSYFECKINGADWESCVSPKTYQGLSDGEHTFSVRATDLFSNISLPTLYTWFIDTEIESPSIFLFDLDSDSQFYTNQSEVAIIAYATAQEDGINWFLSENDEKPTIQDSNWRQENPETFILSSGDGSKTVYIWTKDEAENISQLGNSSSIILDTGSPSVQIFELEPWQRISVFSVSWVGSDLLSGIGDFNVQYATGALDGVWLDLAQETQNNSIEFSGQDGLAYYFRVDARDGAGNESSWSEIFSTRIDINPPVVSFDVSPVQADPVFNLSWEVEDYVSSALEEATPSGIDGIYLQYSVVPAKEGIFLQYQENGSFQDWQIGEILELEESQTQLLVNGQDETTYIFSIQVIDKAGNITDWTEAQTRVKIPKDTTAPLVDFDPISAVQDSIFFSPSWTAQDPIGDIEPSGIDIFSIERTVTPPLSGLKYWGQEQWQDWLSNQSLELPSTQNQISLLVGDNTEHNFVIKAIDKAGNESELDQVSTIISLPKTIIINEIAWMGTKASSSDEWFEMYNPSDIDVDIANWSIYGADTDQCLNFSDADSNGVGNTIIPAMDYLIYANHEDDVRDNSGSSIVDIWDATIGMNNTSPGQIILYNARDCQGAIIDAVNQVDSAWLGGDSGNRVTMERIDFESSGSDINNWADNNLITKNGMDAEGNPIDGTPKAENSVSKSSTEITGTIDFPVLTYLGSPYIVRWTLAVPQEKTLTVEPGVVIKFKDGYSGMEVDGTLKAIGGEADDEKIIFTSWSSNPQPGSWKQIYFSPESAGSELENVIIRYGGNFPSSDASCPWQMAAIRVDQASITLKNSLLEHNKSKGLYLIGSPSTTLIDNVQFSDNIPCQGYFGKYYGTGILIENGSPVVKNSTFKGNIFGIEIRNGASPEIKNNIFEENEKPIYVNNSYPCFSGNQSINNSLNGILVSNSNLTQSDVWQADLPYIIDGTLGISQDTILVLEPGVVIEFKNGQSGITVRGTLKAIGAPDEKIIFTSWSSDPQPGSWKQIYFTETAGADSELSNVIIEYGGNFPSSSASCHWQMAAVFVDKSSIILKNSIVNHNKSKGIYLMNSSSVIDNVQFSNNVPCQGYFGEYYGAGVLIQSGDSIIKNSTFKSNKYGIYIQSGASLLENLTFGEKDEKNNIDIYPIP